MKVLMLALVLVLVLSSCTSTRFVGTNPSKYQKDSINYAEIEKKTAGKSIDVTFRDGHQYACVGISIAADSMRYQLESDQREYVVATRDVRRIVISSYTGGAVAGFMFGAFIGGSLGWGFGRLTARGDMSDIDVALSTLAGTCGGAVGGLLYGGIHGDIAIYEISPERTP
jgi:hypothetical protein